ncbi:MAG: fatty-acyl-CoA synthase, partial [Myxococcota bacterium]
MSSDGLISPTDLGLGLARSWRKLPAIGRLIGTMVAATPHSRLSLGRVLSDTARRHPDSVALRSENGSLTWRYVDRQSNRFAHALAELGVRRGDAVGILMHDGPDMLLLVAAVAKLGAVSAMLNPKHQAGALAHSIGCVKPRLCVVSANLVDRFDAAATGIPH